MATGVRLHRRELLQLCTGVSLISTATCRSRSEKFPSQPIRLMVPYTIGSGTDQEARMLAPYLRPYLGVPVILENEAGADGRIGLARFARADPDGYRLAFYGIPSMILGELLSDVPYRIRDFQHIFAWIRENQVLVFRPESWDDFTSFEREARGRWVNGGVPYLTSAGRLAGLLLAEKAGLRCRWIPFGGSNAALTALLGGHIDFCIATSSACLSLVRSGRLRSALVFADARDHNHPAVPIPTELGYIIPSLPIIRGVAAPHGVAEQVVRSLEAGFERATQNQDFVENSRQAEMPLFPTPSARYREQVEAYYQLIDPFKDLLKREAHGG
jgi:tripartite-type tricarboxylate transporter receptor subunit TctC